MSSHERLTDTPPTVHHGMPHICAVVLAYSTSPLCSAATPVLPLYYSSTPAICQDALFFVIFMNGGLGLAEASDTMWSSRLLQSYFRILFNSSSISPTIKIIIESPLGRAALSEQTFSSVFTLWTIFIAYAMIVPLLYLPPSSGYLYFLFACRRGSELI